MVAYTAAYYGISPLVVNEWTTQQVKTWYDAAIELENEKIKAYKKHKRG